MRTAAAVLAALLALLPLALASPYTVTITVVGPDGQPAASATVYVYYTNATLAAKATTDSSGRVTLDLPSGTYVVVASKGWYAFSTLAVAGDTSATVDASALVPVNVTSTPIAVTANLTFGGVAVPAGTNVTAYVPSGASLTIAFPQSVVKALVLKYVLERVTYDGSTTNQSTVTLTVTAPTVVTAHYKATWALTMEWWMVAAMAGIVLLAVVLAAFAGAKTAKEVIEELRAGRFVRRRGEAVSSTFVHSTKGGGTAFRFVRRRGEE